MKKSLKYENMKDGRKDVEYSLKSKCLHDLLNFFSLSAKKNK